MQPSWFISHGSPMTLVMESPARQFLSGLAATLSEPPAAILAVSAHWETPAPVLNAVARNATIHDFYGFPEPLYALRYPAPGAPELAERIAAMLNTAGFRAGLDSQRGLDHGAWVPLLLAFPQADIPVLQLSVQPALGAAHHLRLGAALAPLRRENVLIMGAGSFTHDLRRLRGLNDVAAPETPDVTAFCDWMHARIMRVDLAALADYRALAPYAAAQHPTDEHLLPLHVALGAAGPDCSPRRMHSSVEFGFLRMDSYAFQ